MRPTGLDHAHVGASQERGNSPAQEIGAGSKVCIKDRGKLSFDLSQAPSQCTRLVTTPVVSMQDSHVNPGIAMKRGSRACDCSRVICRVIQDLDNKTITRIVQGRSRVDQSLNNIAFVENRKLNYHGGPVAL